MATTLEALAGAKVMGYTLPIEDEDAEHEDDPMIDEKMFIPRHATLGMQNAQFVADESKPSAAPTEPDEPEHGSEHAQEGEDEEEDSVNVDAGNDNEIDNKDGEAVGPVKLPRGVQDEDEDEDEDEEDSAGESNDDGDHVPSIDERSNLSENDTSEKDSSDSESDGAAEWEEQSNDRDDEDAGFGINNRCV